MYGEDNFMHELHRASFFSRNSLSRISALGVDGGARASSLSLWGNYCSPFLVYKTSVINILHRPSFQEMIFYNTH